MTIKLAYSIPEAVAATGLSRTYLTDAIRSGRLKARKSSEDEAGNAQGKLVIRAADLEAFIDSLPEAS